MIRLEHSRERFARLPLPEVGGQLRPAGSVTVQLASAGRWPLYSVVFPRIIESPNLAEFPRL